MRLTPGAPTAASTTRRDPVNRVVDLPDRRTPWYPPARLSGLLVHLRRLLPRPVRWA